jgi:hypothetical protein
MRCFLSFLFFYTSFWIVQSPRLPFQTAVLLIYGGMYLSTFCLINLDIFSTCWQLESSVLDFVICRIWKMFPPVEATPKTVTKTPLRLIIQMYLLLVVTSLKSHPYSLILPRDKTDGSRCQLMISILSCVKLI